MTLATPEAPPVGDRRRLAARGVLINSAFLVIVGTLNLLRAVGVAGFLTAAEFGIWSAVALLAALAVALKTAAVSDKYIQQDEPDQEVAFQKAFTLELISAVILVVATAAFVPILAIIYGEPEMLGPGFALVALIPGLALQLPIMVYYRRMDFVRQRLLMVVDPVVAFVASIGLAIAGYGIWSLVIGTIAGAWAGGFAALAARPYPLGWRYDRRAAREYFSFSWPLLIGAGGAIVAAQLMLVFGEVALGLAGVGAIGLASAITAYTDRVDAVVTQALYPAICRVRDRTDLLFEAFVKSNRLTLMWGMPFGLGLALFAPDLVTYALGESWRDATTLLQVFGAVAAINHVGFNWTAFLRAVGNTKPIATVSYLGLGVMLGLGVPLMFVSGLDGFAVGVALGGAVSLVARWHYIRQLFPHSSAARQLGRAVAPSIPAVLAVLALRAVEPSRGSEWVLIELGAYVAITVVATWLLERVLLREAISYIHRPAPAEA